jgi:hypothetical protein
VERDKPKKLGIGWTNFAAVAMETKKEGFNFFDSFHHFENFKNKEHNFE